MDRLHDGHSVRDRDVRDGLHSSSRETGVRDVVHHSNRDGHGSRDGHHSSSSTRDGHHSSSSNRGHGDRDRHQDRVTEPRTKTSCSAPAQSRSPSAHRSRSVSAALRQAGSPASVLSSDPSGSGLTIGPNAWLKRKLHLRPQHRGVHLVTEEILAGLPELAQFQVGIMHIQLLHTSASLTINENWDPDVRDDMEMMLNRLVPEAIPFKHSCEGPDDMPAHAKACLLGSNLTLPICDGRVTLGTWQGVWLCEHRDRAGPRKVLVTVNGVIRDPIRTPQSPASPMTAGSVNDFYPSLRIMNRL